MRLRVPNEPGGFRRIQVRSLSRRKGRKRALVAVGHKILTIVYNVLKYNLPYRELGGDFLERLEPERMTRQLVRRLEKMGHRVTLDPQPA